MHQKLPIIIALLGIFAISGQFTAFAQCGNRYQSEIFDQASIAVTQDVQYGSNVAINGQTKLLKFDFYESLDDNAPMRPLIIWAHGGTFIGGNENSGDIVDLCEAFTKRGYVNASINYRLLTIADATGSFLTGNPPIEELFINEVVKAVADMKAAVRYFRKDAATDNIYRIDPNQIYVGGASAGAFLALHTAYLDTEDGLELFQAADILSILNENGGIEGDSGNDGYPSNVSGAINLCGALGSVDFMQAGEEPVVSIHGDADQTVPYGTDFARAAGFDIMEVAGSQSIQQKADDLGITNALWTIPGADHMAHANGSNFPTTVQFVSDFLYPLIVCEPAVGINEEQAQSMASVSVFPNPASNYLITDLNRSQNNTAHLQLFDNTGRLIKSLKAQGNQYVSLERNDLPAGIYHLQIDWDDGAESVHRKVVFK